MNKNAFLAAILFVTAAQAQSVQQSGTVTPGHAVRWVTNGVVGDAGTATSGSLTSLGITNNGGPGICINSAPISGPYNQLCLAATTNGGAKLSSYVYGGATTPALTVDINGAVGTLITSATSPLVLNLSNGDVSCPTCATSTQNGAALTTGNDSNVTLTAGGSASNALLNAASITAGWTGQLAVSRGGTGLASGNSGGILGFTSSGVLTSSVALAANGVVIGGGAGATPTALVAATNGQVLLGVTSSAPVFASMNGDASITSSGALTVAKVNGVAYGASPSTNTVPVVTGVNAVTYEALPISVLSGSGAAQGDVLYFNGASWVVLAPGTSGQFLQTQGAGANPLWAGGGGGTGTVTSITISAGTGIAVSGTCTVTTTGTCTVATAAGVDTNTLNTQTANYTIQTSDCGKTVQAGTGTTGFFTITLPAVAGFNGVCAVNVKNGDTGRGKSLSGFPAGLTSPSILWPLQSLTVKIINGAWAITTDPGRWAKSNAVFYIDTTGSDSNDGLATGTAAFLTIGHCVAVAELYVDTQANSSSTVTCSPTAGQSFQEFVQVFFPLVGGGTLLFQGNGGAFTWKPTNSGCAAQVGDLAVAGFTNISFDSTGVTTPQCFIQGHNYGVVDINTGITFSAAVALTSNMLTCDFDTHFNINNGFTASGNYSAGVLFYGCQNSSWNINGNLVGSGSPSFGRFYAAQSGSDMVFQGNVTFSGFGTGSAGISTGNAVVNNLSGSTPPGGAPTTATGGQYCTSLC